jgi:lysozyme
VKLSTKSREVLKRLEGFRGAAYIPVPGDRITIGYGFTRGVKMGDRMTRAEADVRLVAELAEYEDAVLAACTRRPNQNQFDALTLLCFNIGKAGLRRSSALRAHNRGDHQAAARAFSLWNKSSGAVYAGLTRRRTEEAALYLKPVPDEVSDGALLPEDAMPQKVDEESSMAASPINRGAAVAGGTAAVAAVSETARTLGDIKDTAGGLGEWLVPVLLIAVVVLCGYVIWERIGQRRGGWA